MSRTGKAAGILVMGLSMVAMAVVVFLRPARPVTQPVTLSDGTRVAVGSVRIGREHYSPYDSPFSRLLARLPSSIGRILKPVISAATPAWSGDAPTLGVWLEWDRPPAVALTNTSPGTTAFLVFLNDGRPFLIGSYQQSVATLRDGRYVEGYFFPVAPSSIPSITIHLYPRPSWGGDEPEERPALAHWDVPALPVPPTVPWVPEPLPQRRTSGDLEVTLQTLVIDARSGQGPGPLVPATLASAAWPFAQFELRQQGLPAPHWQVERIHSIADALGGAGGSFASWSNASNHIRWRWPLWPGQAWKLGVEFTRTTGFESNELVTFTGLDAGTLSTNPAVASTGTVVAKRLRVAPWDSKQRVLELEFNFRAKVAPGRLTFVSATDAQGTPVSGYRLSWANDSTTFRLEKTSISNAPFTVTVALQTGRVVEFLAEPRVLGTNTR